MTALDRLTKANETELRRYYVAACTERFKDVRLFIRNVAGVQIEDRFVRLGVKGHADCWGYLFRDPYPMPLEIELKNVKTIQTDDQKRWQCYCIANRVPYRILRAQAGHTPSQIIEAWCEETERWLTELRR